MKKQKNITMKIDPNDYVREMKRQECMYMPPIEHITNPIYPMPNWKRKISILKENWNYFIIPSIMAYDPLYFAWNGKDDNPISRFVEIFKRIYYGTKSALFHV
jgi:hypothetical protein